MAHDIGLIRFMGHDIGLIRKLSAWRNAEKRQTFEKLTLKFLSLKTRLFLS